MPPCRRWPDSPFAGQALDMLKECGLTVRCGADGMYSTREGACAAPSPVTLLAAAKRFPDLLPLGIAFAALAARGRRSPAPPGRA